MFVKLLKNSFCLRCYSNYTKGPSENPLKRTLRLLSNEYKEMYSNVSNKSPNIEVYKHDNSDIPDFPSHVDVVIIGGGVMGSSIAYWLGEKTGGALKVAVIEKDSTYSKSSTVLSVGGLRQQFSLPENIEMSQYGAEFLRTAKKSIGVDVQFTPRGYLLLANEENAATLERNHNVQKTYNVKNALLTVDKLKHKYPWLNLDGIALGCIGLENEGWFDPWSLLSGFKNKAIKQGTVYVNAEAVGFGSELCRSLVVPGVEPGTCQKLTTLFVKTSDQRVRDITFSKCIIAAGADSAKVAELADIGTGRGLLSLPLHVERRKRYVFCFNSQDPNIPGIDTPMTIDTSGVYFRREGLGNNFIAGRCPTVEEEPNIDNLEVDHEFFNKNIWPILSHRVPSLEGVKITGSWAGYYDYNKYDENAIIGCHPYHVNLYFATGFSGHGIQQAPAVGRAISELMLDGEYLSIDLTRLAFDRFIMQLPMYESNIY